MREVNMGTKNDSLALYFSAFKHSKEAILISNESGDLVAVNKACCDLLLYTKDEMLKMNVDDLLPNRFQHGHKQRRETYYENPKNRSMGEGYELFAKKSDSSEVPVNIGLTHIREDGELFVIAFLVNISQQVEARLSLEKLNTELEQRVAERTQELATIINTLEDANKKVSEKENELREALSKEKELGDMKSRFVTLASHEFRTPLSTILSSANLIDKYTKSDQQDKRQKHINRIKSNVGNLTTILSDFLSFEKLHNGVITVVKEEIQLREFIENSLDEFRQNVVGDKILVLNYIGEDVYKTDISLFGNVINNMISNAIKYSKEEGQIKVDVLLSDNGLEIGVKDTGIGIPADELKYLFSQFFRAKNAANIQGTGLGLNISKQFVELLGGTISVQSIEGKGSTFTIDIPRGHE